MNYNTYLKVYTKRKQATKAWEEANKISRDGRRTKANRKTARAKATAHYNIMMVLFDELHFQIEDLAE